jgi:hypothetical protein
MNADVRLTDEEIQALRVALDALQEDVDFLSHELQTWQDRDWASHQIASLLERLAA